MRVGAYCRVSTGREEQAGSLRSQRSYFLQYIRGHPGWELVQIYADEGISGTSTHHREAFQHMVEDAEEGRLDLILTKEVSRFARNTVDALEYTRRLKGLGVGVVFISDGIDTRAGDGELRLAIMASIAQEESRKTSERVKWGQRRRMEAGVVFGNDSTYGFETRGGALSIREEEARVVRLIYHKLLCEGKGTHIIARELDEAGIPAPRSEHWSPAMVLRVLRNEKYAGDLRQRKSVTTDYLTHRRQANRDPAEQVCLRDHHPAVVPRAEWERAQAELERRRGAGGAGRGAAGGLWCSGRIVCGTCGSRFVLRRDRRPGGAEYLVWCCGGQKRGSGCAMRMLNHRALEACAAFALEALELDRAGAEAELGRLLGGGALPWAELWTPDWMAGALFEEVVVYPDGLALRPYGLERRLRLWFATSGAGERYRTEILRWDLE